MRRVLDQANFSTPTLVEVKFNWSHGHSTPKLLITHASEEGEVNTGFWDPSPTNYHIQWMIRNEDFFILRWGDPDFVREHLGQNMKPNMNGYHIGSEGYIPALDYFTKDQDRKTWRYAFQRQWLFYAVWGRLLYDEATPDEVFEQMFNRRYKSSMGEAMLNAYKLASKMPLRLASFFKSTWDYTLYSEGFMSAMLQTQYGFNDRVSPFISISELMDHQVLDTSFVGIKEYVNRLVNNQSLPPNKVNPLQLSQELKSNSETILSFCDDLSSVKIDDAFQFAQELTDLRIWAGLSQYFALKLEAGVALSRYQITKQKTLKEYAILLLEEAYHVWENLANQADLHYRQVPYWSSKPFGFEDPTLDYFSWKDLLPEVQKDVNFARNLH
jgi:hypothetical protein